MRWMLILVALLAATPAFARETVAILYFDNTGGTPELAGLKVGLAQMLITDLSGDTGFEVVERAQLQAILDEQQLKLDRKLDPSTAVKIGKLLGAKKMLMGGYFKLGTSLQIDARLVDVETSKILDAHGVRGTVETFFAMEAELAQFSRNAIRGVRTQKSISVPMGVPVVPNPAPRTREGDDGSGDADPADKTPDGPSIEAPDPKALEAAVAFSDGLIFMDAGDKPKARESFEKAIAASPRLDDAKNALAKLDI